MICEVFVSDVRLKKPMRCECGRVLTANDVSERAGKVEIACSGCHSTNLELEIDVPDRRW